MFNANLDPYATPPPALRSHFKWFKASGYQAPIEDESVWLEVDGIPTLAADHLVETDCFSAARINSVTKAFEDQIISPESFGHANRRILTIPSLPGLIWIPSLLPPSTQRTLLDRLFHRDLGNPRHKTNLHLHHNVIYPSDRVTSTKTSRDGVSRPSFFAFPSSDEPYMTPRDPSSHGSISLTQFLSKKLRWITLGGQYNWTSKEYPKEEGPDFPPDIGRLVQGLFQDIKPEAAIVNVYSPGDTLSLHRDVSEECNQPLVSISLGCDCIFLVGIEQGESKKLSWAALKLRSGDALYMADDARFAWHGVPKIFSGTCPSSLEAWPSSQSESMDPHAVDQFSSWKGWLANKRVNLNVRQVYAENLSAN
ncbi:MAG: hypothetical protein M1814_003171 [Vezdaea aestivalis]|nr:MAG: hypothetical protein M1814_003171 [Vezdaea aestivalis]